LRHFEQVYISSVIAWLRSQRASGQILPHFAQAQVQPYQPDEEVQRRDEKAKADNEAMTFFEYVTRFIGRNPDVVVAKVASIDFGTIIRKYVLQQQQDERVRQERMQEIQRLQLRLQQLLQLQLLQQREQRQQIQQVPTFPQRAQVRTNNQIKPLQRVIQAQDPSHARNMLFAQNQQQQNGSGFTSLAAQNVGPTGMGLSQGPGSLQQNFVQPSPSVPRVKRPTFFGPFRVPSPLNRWATGPRLSR